MTLGTWHRHVEAIATLLESRSGGELGWAAAILHMTAGAGESSTAARAFVDADSLAQRRLRSELMSELADTAISAMVALARLDAPLWRTLVDTRFEPLMRIRGWSGTGVVVPLIGPRYGSVVAQPSLESVVLQVNAATGRVAQAYNRFLGANPRHERAPLATVTLALEDTAVAAMGAMAFTGGDAWVPHLAARLAECGERICGTTFSVTSRRAV